MNNSINDWLNHTVYTIFNSQKYKCFSDCYKEMDNLYHMIKSFINRYKYNDASFIIGISNTDSKTAMINYTNNGKRGRPKKIVTGIKVDWHIHIYVACKNTSISVFTNSLRLYLQKKKNMPFYQKKNTLCYALPYIEKQCLYIRRYGNTFKKSLYKNIN